MAPPRSALGGGDDPDGNNDQAKAKRLAARAERFNNKLEGNRYKELLESRKLEIKQLVEQGLITSGQTLLSSAVDFRGTCEDMCCEFEREYREFVNDVHGFERLPNNRLDHAKAVAGYTRSDAGAGHGEAAKLPSDMRTPAALVRSLDYLVSEILPKQPPPNPNAVNPPPPSQRRALGHSAGFIRDRTRAIRKEFAMQSSWGHEEAIASFERIARWHIICLRELQEETGTNIDMHIDSAELGRAFVSLRQHYNDRREELQTDLPCPNEPEFRAYMLIFDLANKSVSIPTAELPAVIIDHPLVQLAWQIRQAAQRNFDVQKEGSKLNSELGANLITRFVRLLKQQQVPYLLSCLVEVRLRDMRRSALRALTMTYPPLRMDPVKVNDEGEVVERRMVLINSLDRLLGAEEQESEGPAWDDVTPVSTNPDEESAAVVERFGVKVHYEAGEIVGAMINKATPYNDNKDAPFTRRWKLITDKLGSATYGDVVNGKAGVSIEGAAAQPAMPGTLSLTAPVVRPSLATSTAATHTPVSGSAFPLPSGSAFMSSNGVAPAPAVTAFGNIQPLKDPSSAFKNDPNAPSAFNVKKAPAFDFKQPAAPAFDFKKPPAPAFDFKKGSAVSSAAEAASVTPDPIPQATAALPPPTPVLPPPSAATVSPTASSPPAPAAVPDFFGMKNSSQIGTPAAKPPVQFPSFFPSADVPKSDAPVAPRPRAPIPDFFSRAITQPEAGPSKPAALPSFSFFPSTSPPATPVSRPFSPPKPPPTPPTPEIPRIKMSYMAARLAGPTLRDRLIKEVLQEIIDDHTPYFEELLSNKQAATARAAAFAAEERAKHARLKREAELAFQLMVDEEVKIVCWAEAASQRRSRERMRSAFDHWRQYATAAAEERRREEQRRQAEWKRRDTLPLRSLNYSYGPGSSMRSTRSLSRASTSHFTSQEDMNEQLRQTQRSADQLWRRGTFLDVIMDHVAPLLRRSGELRQSHSPPTWETVLLTAENSGTPASVGSRGWLRDKLSPPQGDVSSHRGVDFYLTSTDVHGEFPGSSDAGLFVFEAPRNTVLSQSQVERNAEDASDRLQAAASSSQQRGRYRSALLLVSWDSETQEELISRLGIEQDVQLFDTVATISMEYPDALEDLLRTALEVLVPSDPCKGRVVVPLDDLVSQLEEEWQRIVYMSGILSKEHGDSVPLASAAMTAAVNVLSAVPGVINDAVESEPICNEATYDPPTLPPLHLTDGNLANVSSQISTYLSQSPLDGVQSIALANSCLRQATSHSRPITIGAVLSALGSFVLGTIRQQTLPLDMWLPSPEPEEAVRTIVTRITETFHDVVNREIRILSRAARDAKETADALVAAATPLPPSPSPVKVKVKKGIKRRHDDDQSTTTKAARRLRKLLAYHDKTFGELDAPAERVV